MVSGHAHSFGNGSPGPLYHRAVKREFSAGGVVVRRMQGRLARRRDPSARAQARDSGRCRRGTSTRARTPAETAVREVHEETGVVGKLDEKLGDVKYTYTWDGERIFKIVSFFLVRYSSGRLGEIAPEMEVEVDEARWLPIEEAPEAPRLRR